MQGGEIRPLTGLRFLAALAVLVGQTWLAHQGFLREHFPDHAGRWAVVMRQEHVLAGVFFCLSGFVLGHRYLARLTPGLAQRGPELRSFLLARVARIWPAYLLAVHVMLALLVARSVLADRPPRPGLDAVGYLRQVLLVHLWTEPDHVHTSWLPVGWALSALVAATLAFPLLAVLVERIVRVTTPGTRLGMACLLPVPVMIVLTAAPRSTDGYLWTLLVFCYFLAGLLASTAVAVVAPRRRGRWSLVLAGGAVALAAFSAWVATGTGVSARGLVAMGVVPVVVAVACCTGVAARLLGSGLLVAGGRVSYALVLVCAPVIAMHEALVPGYVLAQRPMLVLATIALAWLAALVAAVALWRLVEAPVRRSFGPPRAADSASVPARTGAAS